MDLILSRHGNTFAPGQAAVWAGSTNDLPLVEKGIAQAEALAAALLKQQKKISAVYCGPLVRTTDYARIICKRLALPFEPKVDQRLNEIDYGDWTGLTDPEVVAQFGEKALRDWNQKSIWPTQGGWGSNEPQIKEEVRSFFTELSQRYEGDETLLLVSSNGRLRYFLTLVVGEFEKRIETGLFKVKTGHICKLQSIKNIIKLSYWDKNPEIISDL